MSEPLNGYDFEKVRAVAPPLRRERFIRGRDLLLGLVDRELKLRYKRSVMGLGWSLLNPLARLLVFVVVFQHLLPLGIPNYPAFVFSGLLAWSWFELGVVMSAGAVVDRRELVRTPGFPIAILPVVTVTTHLVHFLLALPILGIFLVVTGHAPTPALAALPAVIAVQFMLILSLAYVAATCHVTFRDTQYILELGLYLLFFLTPVLYDSQFVSERFRPLYQLNPMAQLLGSYRRILLEGQWPNPRALLSVAFAAVVLLAITHAFFSRASQRFVDEL